MAIAVQHMKECSLVLLEGRIEVPDCSFLKEVLRIATLSRNKSIWVDCERIASISAEALRKLLVLTRKAKSEGVNLLFYQMEPSVRKCVEEAGLEAVLHIVPSIAEASLYCKEQKNQKEKPSSHDTNDISVLTINKNETT